MGYVDRIDTVRKKQENTVFLRTVKNSNESQEIFLVLAGSQGKVKNFCHPCK